MNFNTPFVIEHYESGTASLDDRLEAARKVQDAKGFRLRIVIEPIIKYPNYEKDYVELAGRIMRSLDPERIEEIAMGCVRYSGRLEARVRRNFPETDLFTEAQGLLPQVKNDRRRYPLDERVRLYKMVHEEFRKHTKVYIRLGAETADVWEALCWDSSAFMQKSAYQFPGK
jgi:spore photoproduct lyase